MFEMEQVAMVAKPGEKPAYSPHGYCITPDGTTYALLRQYWHGALLAMLYPEQAAQAGYQFPEDPDELNVYEFQRFELDNHDLFPVIRICPTRMSGPTSVDRGCSPSTPEQIQAVRLVMKELGLGAQDEVATDHRDMTVREMFDYLRSDADVWGTGEAREPRQHRLIKKGEDPFSSTFEDSDNASSEEEPS